MARWEVEDVGKDVFDKLDFETVRKIRRKMVENGAKVLQKEIQNEMETRHHVLHDQPGYMKASVGAGPIHEDIDGTSVEVWPQGTDPRGASNEMKLQIIEYGYYNIDTGKRHKKKDFFLGEKFRKKCAPRIVAVMQATLSKCMDEIDR